MENTPEAAAPATEATNTNQAPAEAPAAPAEPAKADAPATNDLGLTAEQVAEFKKFVDANGGFDKSFKTFKERISNPTPEAPKEQTHVQQPVQPQPTNVEQAQAIKTPDGYMSPQEIAIQTVYDRLASDPKYSAISDKISNGDMFAEMAKFGIRPADEYGNVNVKQVREFFDLYAKTVPATPAATPEGSQAPTVDYVPVNNGKIESFSQAAQIIAQSQQLKSKGLAEHPDVVAAKEFIKNSLAPKKKQ